MEDVSSLEKRRKLKRRLPSVHHELFEHRRANMSATKVSTRVVSSPNSVPFTSKKVALIAGVVLFAMIFHLSFDLFDFRRDHQRVDSYGNQKQQRDQDILRFQFLSQTSPSKIKLSKLTDLAILAESTEIFPNDASDSSSTTATHNDDIRESKNPGETSADSDPDENEISEKKNDPEGIDFPSGPYGGYNSKEQLNKRCRRFPSIEDRVKVYMTNWYQPPCKMATNRVQLIHYKFLDNNSTLVPKIVHEDHSYEELKLWIREIPFRGGENSSIQDQRRTFHLSDSTGNSVVHYMSREKFSKCKIESCVDVVRNWYPALDYLTDEMSGSKLAHKKKKMKILAPSLFQFGDHVLSKAYQNALKKNDFFPAIPHLKKTRESIKIEIFFPGGIGTSCEKHSQTKSVGDKSGCYKGPLQIPETVKGQLDHLQPIIYKLKTRRHYGMLPTIPGQDRPWSSKENMVIFRGASTGSLRHIDFIAKLNEHEKKMRNDPEIIAETKCLLLDRCRLVYRNANTSIVDAKLINRRVQNEIPSTIRGIEMFGSYMTKRQMLKYKAIIMLEGNDVGTGLKWALFSNSVVMMIPPKYTSWAMEELLVPWVHYIPLHEDLSDVEEKMRWVLDNDSSAEDIARQGSLWILDLVFHPDASKDDEKISQEIARRYFAHFYNG